VSKLFREEIPAHGRKSEYLRSRAASSRSPDTRGNVYWEAKRRVSNEW